MLLDRAGGRVGSKPSRPIQPSQSAQPAAPSSEKFLEMTVSAASPSGRSVSTCGRHSCDAAMHDRCRFVLVGDRDTGRQKVPARFLDIGNRGRWSLRPGEHGRRRRSPWTFRHKVHCVLVARMFGGTALSHGPPGLGRTTLLRLLSRLHCRLSGATSVGQNPIVRLY